MKEWGKEGGGVVGQKDHPTFFSPATSTNVVISSENFLTLSFNHFVTLE